MTPLRILLALSLVAVFALAASPAASAHKTVYTDDGKVKVVWGFLDEPAITHTKTGLDLRLEDNATGAPITGADETLTASLLYLDQEHVFDGFGAQHGREGAYTDVITLTRPGLYSLKLVGTIGGTEIDMTIPARHEVRAIDATFFPADAPDPYGGDASALQAEIDALRARIDALEAKAATQSETPATVTDQSGANPVPAPAVALAVLVALGVALLRRRGR